MSISHKSTHVTEGINNLIDQFKDKPKITALLRSYLYQIQEVEDVLASLLTDTTLDNSEGQHLDNIGSVVGEPRAGRSDIQYRTAIRARIKLNTSEGTIEDVIELAISVAGAPVTITITEIYPAGFFATINEPIDPAVTDVNRIASFIASGRPVGVRGVLLFSLAGAFSYDGPSGSGYDFGTYGGAVIA